MIYIFDTNSIRTFSGYFPAQFTGFWALLDQIIDQGSLLSVREVYHELEDQSATDFVLSWAKKNKHIFMNPDQDELAFVAQIFKVEHFQQLVSEQQIQRGSHVADPFIIASAYVKNGCVVTEERAKPNAAKIPNVCSHFDIDCTNLEGFMKRENWSFESA